MAYETVGLDWTSSMQQTYEFYKVNPRTWLDETPIKDIRSCTINRDRSAETLGSATFDGVGMEGEFYIRVYLMPIQNGRKYKIPLGTFLVQTRISSYTGKRETLNIEAYTPLIELKEKYPPVGYSLLQGDDILKTAGIIVAENIRAPVVKNETIVKTVTNPGGFVSEIEDTWLSYITALLGNAKYELSLDPLGNVMFSPITDPVAMQPVFTYNDDNSSIIYPEVSMDYDLYNVPNVVEVVLSNSLGYYKARVVNNDSNSKISVASRGREVVHRVTNPDDLIATDCNTEVGKAYINDYARDLLRNLSTIKRTINYTHGYCPVRVGDCIRFNYSRANMRNIKAVVESQSISCVPGCPVSEKAVYTERLWGD